MTSIQRRLFVVLLAATGVIWLSAAVWIQSSTRSELDRVLDNRLAEAARMVGSLVDEDGLQLNAAMDLAAPALPGETAHSYARQLSCQVWGLDGTRLAASSQAPQAALSGSEQGFSEREVEGLVWRVYTHVDETRGIRVMVGDSLQIRERLLTDMVMGLMWPTLLILPLLAAAIWISLGRGLSPLRRIAEQLTRRGADDLAALEAETPREVAPMVAALNGLFGRVQAARRREQDFTAYAAHELKTPLAGLKMQAEVARLAPDAATRDHALAQIRRAVDRSDRLVHQLLDMAAVDQGAEDGSPRSLAEVCAEVVDLTAPAARARGVTLRQTCDDRLAAQPHPAPGLLIAALRNLVENALHASPEGGSVELELRADGDGWRAEVRDEGPGIADADRARITERFHRGEGRGAGRAEGSGLGLAIVETAAAQMGARFTLERRQPRGELARLSFAAPPAA